MTGTDHDEKANAPKRPRRRTKLLKAIFKKNIYRTAGNINRACAMTEIARCTYYRWIKADPVFKEQVEDIVQGLHEGIVDRLYLLCLKNYFPAIKYYLNTKGKHMGFGGGETESGNPEAMPLTSDD